MRMMLAALVWAAFLLPAEAKPCVTRQAVSTQLLANNPTATIVLSVGADRIPRLLALFNRTPPTTTRLTRSEVETADIWSKPRSEQALVIFYGSRGCFLAYMRATVQSLKTLYPKSNFDGSRA